MSIITCRGEPGTIGSGDHSPRLWPTAIHWFKHRSLRHAPLMFILVMVPTVLPIMGCSDDSSTAGQNDASIDAIINPVDNDGDQYTSDVDCDDNDDTIYPGVERDCASDCFNGTEVCLDNGQWSPCSASTDCDCTQPGETRVVDCPKCGWAYQECGTDYKWDFPGECMDQLDCNPGEEQDEECGMCGNRTRLCNPDCRWRDWGECQGEGVCHTGTREWTTEDCSVEGAVQERECNDQCQWDSINDCTTDCLLPARTGTADFKDEVCIPGGPFVMGSDPGEYNEDEEPEHIVILTPYYVDVYEVTRIRYKECYDAGACSEPEYPVWENPYRAVAGVSWQQALEFCAWDDGRTLPSEAQWEKAARGPAPREVIFTWGDTPLPTCEHINASSCFGAADDVDSRPLGMSYYGVYNMLGNVEEWTLDAYNASFYSSSPLIDPVCTSGTYRSARGFSFEDHLFNCRTSVRIGLGPDWQNNWRGFRCARRGY